VVFKGLNLTKREISIQPAIRILEQEKILPKPKSEVKSKYFRSPKMSESEEYYCPNEYCRIEKLTVEEKACPECGAYAQKIKGKELAKLLQQKRALSPQQENETTSAPTSKQDGGSLFSDEMTDDQIRMLISQDMSNLATHEAGIAWMSPSTFRSLKATDQIIGSGLKALVDQNKIMIRQNELIIRDLKKLAGKMEESRH
jgi:hypothetical protein